MAGRCVSDREQCEPHANADNPALAVVGAKKRMNSQRLVREAVIHERAQPIMNNSLKLY